MSTLMKLGVAGVRALAFSTLVCLAVAGCSAERPIEPDPDGPAVTTSEAIVRGALDRGRHPAVVAVMVDDGPSRALCTGVVVARDAVLTARHCLAESIVDTIRCPAREPQLGRHAAASAIAIHAADDVREAPPVAWGRSVRVPPGDALCDADLALVTLDRPLEGVTPLQLSRLAPRVSDRIVAVGYGQVGDRGRSGVRRFRTDVVVTRTTAFELTVSESTCSGDSGGPAIDAESGEVVGILSRGSERCRGGGAWNVYVQTAPHLAWIERALGHASAGAPATKASDVGEPCVDGASCAAGYCVTSSPTSYCSRPCGPDIGRCPNGFRCARSTGASAGVCAIKV